MPSSEASDDLSDLDSADFEKLSRIENSDNDNEETDTLKPPPAKRRRVTQLARSPQQPATPSSSTARPQAEDWSDVSSDSTSSVPPSPRAMKDLSLATSEADSISEHVRVCQWQGCEVGDLGNQDELVKHVNDVHVPESKDEKFMCDWGPDCRKRTKPQGSAYALKAHMRSHTKEKPYYCHLPECDKSFTRTDALTKHLRTVHHSESDRTKEYYPRMAPLHTSSTAANTPIPDPSAPAPISVPEKVVEPPVLASKPSLKLKLNMNGKSKQSPSTTDFLEDIMTAPLTPLSPGTRDEAFGAFPAELQFDDEELAMDRRELFRLLRRQIHWAEQDGKELERQASELVNERREEWLAKELVIENLLEADFAAAERLGVFDRDGRDMTFGDMEDDMIGMGQVPEDRMEAADKETDRILGALERDAEIAAKLPLRGGEEPWYRGEDVIRERNRKKEAQAEPRQVKVNGHVVNVDGPQDTTMVDGEETEDEMA